MPIGKNGLLALADSVHNRADLETMEIDPTGINDEKLYMVDIKTKKIKPVITKDGSSIAATGVKILTSLLDVDTSKFKYVKNKANKK
ncbi:MAG: hypothetical protein ACHQF0_16395 [Chitinophagales bacterium]